MKTFSKKLTLTALLALAPMTSQAYITTSPSWVNFRDTEVGHQAFREYVDIRNSSGDTVNGVFINSGCLMDFDVAGFCPSTLGPYQSCSISIGFRPSREGYFSCSINVSSSAGFDSVQVSGRGTAAQPVDKPAAETDGESDSNE